MSDRRPFAPDLRVAERVMEEEVAGSNGGRLVGRPVVIGEVLYDRFPDGSCVLGGAPFNLAWHLQALGLEPLLISRVGADREGADVLDAMSGWGLDVSGVQLDHDHPTGAVEVRFDRGSPVFEIHPDQAWDYLDSEAALASLADQRMALLCHGSLIARQPRSREALAAVRARTPLPVFIDVNLRDPFWSEELLRSFVAGSYWVKLNEHELWTLDGEASKGVAEAAAKLRVRWALDQVWVTRGGAGALVDTGAGFREGRPAVEVEVVDSVGAGDAFSAMVVFGLVSNWTPQRTLREALAFAARICTLRGATVSDPGIYADLTTRKEQVDA